MIRLKNSFSFFTAGKSEGLMQAGRARLNQSIEVFVDRLLSAQVNVRNMSSILSSSGSAKEAQHKFLVLAEDVI